MILNLKLIYGCEVSVTIARDSSDRLSSRSLVLSESKLADVGSIKHNDGNITHHQF
jgi:hypothetical protein